jgi:hypothetical protein
MPISFVNAGAKGAAASGNITLGAPASPQNDDIWIATVHSSDNVAHSFTGWTQIFQQNGFGTTSRLSVWYFRYAGSTPNLVVTHTAGQSPIGGIGAYRGCKTTGSPVNTTGTGSTGNDASIEVVGITPSVDNCMLIFCDGAADDNYTLDANRPSGFTAAINDPGNLNSYLTNLGTPDGRVAQFYKLHTSGATGVFTGTMVAGDPWCSVLIALEPPVAGVVFQADGGSYTETGTALTFGLSMPAILGAHAFTGSLMVPRLAMPAAAVSYSATGDAVGVRAIRAMVGASGSAALTGTDATLTLTTMGLSLSAETGSYALSGTSLTPAVGLPVLTGTYTLSGTAAPLRLNARIQATAASYALTGTATTPRLAMTALAGGAVVTGSAATPGVSMPAASTTYTQTGTAAVPRVIRTLSTVAGSAIVTGTAAVLIYTPALPVLVASSGSYTLTGTATIPRVQLPASAGVYPLTGTASTLTYVRKIPATSTSYVWTGSPASLIAAVTVIMSAASGSYLIMAPYGITQDLPPTVFDADLAAAFFEMDRPAIPPYLDGRPDLEEAYRVAQRLDQGRPARPPYA